MSCTFSVAPNATSLALSVFSYNYIVLLMNWPILMWASILILSDISPLTGSSLAFIPAFSLSLSQHLVLNAVVKIDKVKISTVLTLRHLVGCFGLFTPLSSLRAWQEVCQKQVWPFTLLTVSALCVHCVQAYLKDSSLSPIIYQMTNMDIWQNIFLQYFFYIS